MLLTLQRNPSADPTQAPSGIPQLSLTRGGRELLSLYSLFIHTFLYSAASVLLVHAVATVTSANDLTGCSDSEGDCRPLLDMRVEVDLKPAETLRREYKTLWITSDELVCEIIRR